MAREVSEIQKTLDEAQASKPELSVFNSTSQVALYKLWKYVYAVASNLLEQLMDIYKAEVETIVDSAAPGSDYWFQKKVLEFQYSATNPQSTVLVNLVPQYPTVDTTLRIISRCSVRTKPNRVCEIKVATGEPPAALSGPQLSALQGYISSSGSPSTNGKGLGFAGVQYSIISLSPDLIKISGDIYYNGQYSSVIKNNVVAAIENYLKNIPFDGVIKVNAIVDAVQAVDGVVDFVFKDIGVRAATVAYPTYTYLTFSSQILLPSHPLVAGYVIGETTIGSLIGDNLTFIAQN